MRLFVSTFYTYIQHLITNEINKRRKRRNTLSTNKVAYRKRLPDDADDGTRGQ